MDKESLDSLNAAQKKIEQYAPFKDVFRGNGLRIEYQRHLALSTEFTSIFVDDEFLIKEIEDLILNRIKELEKAFEAS